MNKIQAMDALIKRHIDLVNQTPLDFQRSIMTQLPWDQRLIGIKGSRGVGKTTLLLQYIKQKYGTSLKAMYISLDNLYFTENSLSDFVEDFVARGGEHLFVDEVHKYSNWAIEIKNIYDYYPNLKIVFTGSSLLEILNSRVDLSRRALIYNMQGLSFREFLAFRYNIELPVVSLNEIIENHTRIALELKEKVKPLKYFEEYLRVGYFPFYDGNEVLYYKRLQEIINMIIEIELPLLRNTDASIIGKIKQMLYIISLSSPFKPNVSALAAKIKTTRKTVLEYINYLNDANVLNVLRKDSFGVSLLQKPEKIFLENTNYMYAILTQNPEKGNLRETFMMNQLAEKHKVNYSDKADFTVDDTYTFETGGKNKDGKQIEGLENAFVAADGIEFGYDNKIPLWLFGFMY